MTHNFHWKREGSDVPDAAPDVRGAIHRIGTGVVDLIAERIRAPGFPHREPAAYAKLTSIAEPKGVPAATEMIRQLVKGSGSRGAQLQESLCLWTRRTMNRLQICSRSACSCTKRTRGCCVRCWRHESTAAAQTARHKPTYVSFFTKARHGHHRTLTRTTSIQPSKQRHGHRRLGAVVGLAVFACRTLEAVSDNIPTLCSPS